VSFEIKQWLFSTSFDILNEHNKKYNIILAEKLMAFTCRTFTSKTTSFASMSIAVYDKLDPSCCLSSTEFLGCRVSEFTQ
jgi:hypothetical protein